MNWCFWHPHSPLASTRPSAEKWMRSGKGHARVGLVALTVIPWSLSLPMEVRFFTKKYATAAASEVITEAGRTLFGCKTY